MASGAGGAVSGVFGGRFPAGASLDERFGGVSGATTGGLAATGMATGASEPSFGFGGGECARGGGVGDAPDESTDEELSTSGDMTGGMTGEAIGGGGVEFFARSGDAGAAAGASGAAAERGFIARREGSSSKEAGRGNPREGVHSGLASGVER